MKQSVSCSYCGVQILRNKSRSGIYFCTTYHKAKWQVAQREALGFDREWLVREYINKRRSANDIAREIGRDPKRVWEWMRDYGIEIRPRGTDYGNGFKAGNESPFKGMSHTPENKERFRQLRLLDGRLPYIKDGKHWLHHEGAVSPAWKGGITPERQAFYASEEWRKTVKVVWARDDAKCCRCGKHHNTTASRGTFHIHHIVSFQNKDLRASAENLVLLCRDCHLFVHSNANVGGEFMRASS